MTRNINRFNTVLSNWNEYILNPLTRTNWRASLVPAAAVIPAPIAYTKVVAVKKLVVGFLRGWGDRVLQMASRVSNARASCRDPRYHSFGGVWGPARLL